jgi:hypothetical protein
LAPRHEVGAYASFKKLASAYFFKLDLSTGALVSIPFLFVADPIVDKIGQESIF